MRVYRLAVVFGIALAFPAGLGAQQAGFRVGIASPGSGNPGFGLGVATAASQNAGFGLGVAPNPYGGSPHARGNPYGGNLYNPYANPYTGVPTYINPYTGVPNYPSPYPNVLPGGAILVPPTATIVTPGTAIFVSPGQKAAPGYTAPRYSGRRGGVFTNPRNHRNRSAGVAAAPGVIPPGSGVIAPAAGGIFVSGRDRRGGVAPGAGVAGRTANRGNAIADWGGIEIGSTRAAVLAQFGRPTVSMADRNGEAMVFGGTTILIQNGVVTRITPH